VSNSNVPHLADAEQMPEGLRGRTAWFDVSDLMDFIKTHDSVTGIQRVVLQILHELRHYDPASLAAVAIRSGTRNATGIGAIRYCHFDRARRQYRNVTPSNLDDAIAAFTIAQFAPVTGWRQLSRFRRRNLSRLNRLLDRTRYILNGKAATAARTGTASSDTCAFQPGDIMVELGSFWSWPGQVSDLVAACTAHRMAFALVIHDLIPVRCPELFSARAIAEWSVNATLALRSAALVLAPSQYTLRDVEAYCREQDIPLMPRSLLRWGASAIDRAERFDEVRPARFASVTRHPYVLMVATQDARKNHDLVIRVWSRLYATHRAATPHLLLVGKSWSGSSAVVKQLKALDYVGGRVVLLDDVGDAELALLYERSLFTVFPSRAEGWGLPVGESLCHGKVCLASNAWSIPEVGGDLVDYFDPTDDNECYALVERYAFDSSARAAREQRIRSSYVPPTWADTARMLLAALNRCAAGRS
jgi:glycosyltransferase involved in cell wall biosynthesis